jgi:predicted anti-sigma-YlaC factor YlaD
MRLPRMTTRRWMVAAAVAALLSAGLLRGSGIAVGVLYVIALVGYAVIIFGDPAGEVP